MNFENYQEPCLQCGAMTDQRNRGFCSRYCEESYTDKICKYDHPVSGITFKQPPVPSWEDVKYAKHRPQPKNLRQHYLKQRQEKQQARQKLWEETRANAIADGRA